MACHLAVFTMFVLPLGNLIGPLVVWLLKKDQIPFVAEHGRESLNFQITMTIGYVIGVILHLIFLGWLVIGGLFVVNILFVILATMAANEGKSYRYPISIRLIK